MSNGPLSESQILGLFFLVAVAGVFVYSPFGRMGNYGVLLVAGSLFIGAAGLD